MTLLIVLQSFILLYDDDASILYKGNNIYHAADVINNEVKIISYWLNTNKLSLNVTEIALNFCKG